MRIQFFVDDPAILARGSREHRTRCFVTLLLWWLALGLELSWAKIKRGSKVRWIGAMLEIQSSTG